MPNPLQSACHTLSPKAHWCQLPCKTPQGPSWWSSSWDSVLPRQGAWVRSPGGELRSLMLLGATKKKKKKLFFKFKQNPPGALHRFEGTVPASLLSHMDLPHLLPAHTLVSPPHTSPDATACFTLGCFTTDSTASWHVLPPAFLTDFHLSLKSCPLSPHTCQNGHHQKEHK